MSYAQEMSRRLPDTMKLPNEFDSLFDWMDANGFFMPSGRYPGERLGLIGTEEQVQSGLVTAILFRVETPEQAQQSGDAWFGGTVPDIARRLVPFARTGGDGSYAAFWLDDDSRLQIAHLGSEGLTCLLGPTPLDFLRLLAIGYSEISGDCLDGPAVPPRDAGHVNTAFRAWLVERWDVDIPETAEKILGDIPDSRAEDADDPFFRWVRRHLSGLRAEPEAPGS